MKNLLSLLFLFFLFINSSNGQLLKGDNVINFDPVTDANSVSINGNIYVASLQFNQDIKGNVLTLYCYSSDLQLKYEKSFNEVLPEKYKFVDDFSMYVMKNQIVISTAAKKSLFAIESTPMLILINPETKTAIANYNLFEEGEAGFVLHKGYDNSIIASPTKFTRDNLQRSFNMTFNEDSTKILLMIGTGNYVILDKNLKKLYSGFLSIPKKEKGIKSTYTGIFFYREMLYLWTLEARPTFKEKICLYKFNPADKTANEVIFNLPDDYNILANAYLTVTPQGFMLFSMVNYNGSEKGYKGIFTAEFDASHNLTEKKYYPFSEEFKSDYITEKNSTTLAYMNIIKTNISEKGDIYVVLERGDIWFAMKPSKEDVTILKINKGIGFEWTKRIRKNEATNSKTYVGYMGTSVSFNNGYIYLTYTDNPENKNVLDPNPKEANITDEKMLVRLVKVSEAGNVDSKLITDSYFEEPGCKFFWATINNNKLISAYKTPMPIAGNADYIARKRHYAFRFYNLGQ